MPHCAILLLLLCEQLGGLAGIARADPAEQPQMVSQDQPPAPATAGSMCEYDEVCDQLTRQAYEDSKRGRLEAAQQGYLNAYRRRPDTRLLYNRARMLHRAQRFPEARAIFQQYLDVGAEGNEAFRQQVQKEIEGIDRELSAQAARQAALAISAAQAKAPPAPEPRPLYRRWWFWTAIGTATAGLAVGIGLGVASRRPDVTGLPEVSPFANKQFP